MASSEANAEDLLQQALLQAWAALCAGAKVREAGPWLYRIVHNLAATDSRQAAPRLVALYDVPDTRGADHEAEQRMEARSALKSIAALPLQQRQVMVGTAVEGLSHEEVARELGLSSGAVRGLIYRARATLRAAAAAFVPGPVVAWVAREGSGAAGGSGVAEAIATGSGSAGLGGLLLKGGAIAVTAGAFATATGITIHRGLRLHHQGQLVVRALPDPSGPTRSPAGAAQVSARLASSRASDLLSRTEYRSGAPSALRATGGNASGSRATVRAHDSGRQTAASWSGGSSRGPRGSGRASGAHEPWARNGAGASAPAAAGSGWNAPSGPRPGSGLRSGTGAGWGHDSGAVPSPSGAPTSSGFSDRVGSSTSYGSFGGGGSSAPSGSSSLDGRSNPYAPDATGSVTTRRYAPMAGYDTGGVSRPYGGGFSRTGSPISTRRTSWSYGGSGSRSTAPSSPMTGTYDPRIGTTQGTTFRSGTP